MMSCVLVTSARVDDDALMLTLIYAAAGEKEEGDVQCTREGTLLCWCNLLPRAVDLENCSLVETSFRVILQLLSRART